MSSRCIVSVWAARVITHPVARFFPIRPRIAAQLRVESCPGQRLRRSAQRTFEFPGKYFLPEARTRYREFRETRVGEPTMAASESTSMNKTLKTLATLGCGMVLLSFVVVVINQTAGVVQLAKEVSPTLGAATLWGLLIAYGGLIGVPVVI